MVKRKTSPKKKASLETKYKSRIKSFKIIPSSKIRPSPFNWRKHPKSQVNALRSMLNDIGYIDAVVVRKIEGDKQHKYELVDGHLRTGDADGAGVPSLITDLTEDEAKRAITVFDPLGSMAIPDEDMLTRLVSDVTFPDDLILEDIFGGQADDTPSLERILPEQLPSVLALKDDVVWPSALPYGINDLRMDMLADLPDNVQTWVGSDVDWKVEDSPDKWWLYIYKTAGVTAIPAERSIVSFYTDDTAFEMLWDNPVKYTARMLHFGFPIAMTPNFSMWPQQASAVWIWNTYRARWIGRYMQEAGIKIIPDINFTTPESFDIVEIGIPKGAPCISFQVQTLKTDYEEEQSFVGVDEMVRRLEPQKVLLYGEPGRARRIFEGADWFEEKARVIANWSFHRVRQRYNDPNRKSMRTISGGDVAEAIKSSEEEEAEVLAETGL